MKNPDWIREELILALDLYFKLDYGQMHGRNPEIIKLSKDLNKLNIHKIIPDPKKFRSTNSVALKLANLKKLDQNFPGNGMKDGGKLEKEIWKEFYRHRDKLKKEAELIRQLYIVRDGNSYGSLSFHKTSDNDDLEMYYLYHKSREKDPVINAIKKEMQLKGSGSLKCEVCNFDAVKTYGELGRHSVEAHFCKELTGKLTIQNSTVEDFILVCRNCHEVLDKNYGVILPDDLRRIIKK